MAVTAFQDLPLASRRRRWDVEAADTRLRRWAGAEEAPNAKYRTAFVWYDAANKDAFGAYKLPIADVVGGHLKAVPRAIMSAGGIVRGARGGVDLPKQDIPKVKAHLAKYYEKMGMTAPWKRRD